MNELTHWGARRDHKYIKREWKNGRWQYTYADDKMLDGKKRTYIKDDTGHHSSKSKYGTFVTKDGNHSIKVTKSDKLFTTKEGYSDTGNKANPKTGELSKKTGWSNIEIHEGKLARGDTKVQKKAKSVKKEVKDYGKAISSKDEADKYIKSTTGKEKITNKNRKKLVKESDKLRKKADSFNDEELLWLDYSTSGEFTKANEKSKKLKKDYEDAKTVKGKANDLKKAVSKHHPKVARAVKKAKKNSKKSVNKGRNYIRSRFRD